MDSDTSAVIEKKKIAVGRAWLSALDESGGLLGSGVLVKSPVKCELSAQSLELLGDARPHCQGRTPFDSCRIRGMSNRHHHKGQQQGVI
ncbi:MAG: hypothetical protein GX181_06615 [Synergistaceae bacterium]|nr:hypothetical protein [Synergistota bacterium]NLM71613.1 hypothetical protein [Synergistaceae bacterium]